jgi:hypothetical protein
MIWPGFKIKDVPVITYDAPLNGIDEAVNEVFVKSTELFEARGIAPHKRRIVSGDITKQLAHTYANVRFVNALQATEIPFVIADEFYPSPLEAGIVNFKGICKAVEGGATFENQLALESRRLNKNILASMMLPAYACYHDIAYTGIDISTNKKNEIDGALPDAMQTRLKKESYFKKVASEYPSAYHPLGLHPSSRRGIVVRNLHMAEKIAQMGQMTYATVTADHIVNSAIPLGSKTTAFTLPEMLAAMKQPVVAIVLQRKNALGQAGYDQEIMAIKGRLSNEQCKFYLGIIEICLPNTDYTGSIGDYKCTADLYRSFGAQQKRPLV